MVLAGLSQPPECEGSGVHLSSATHGWNRTSSRSGVSISYCEHNTHTLLSSLLSHASLSLFGINRFKMASHTLVIRLFLGVSDTITLYLLSRNSIFKK